jgi:signal transduction histidine kinase
VAFYRIAQEALNNIVKHARASEVQISLHCEAAVRKPGAPLQATLTVRDNGRGFRPDGIAQDRMGLGIMRERAEAVGARLEIVSNAGQGTTIRLSWQEVLERIA